MQPARPGIRLFAHTYNPWSFLFYLLLAISLGVVLATFLDYGITIDEPPQVEYGKEIIQWYRSLFQYQAYFDRVKTLDLNATAASLKPSPIPLPNCFPFPHSTPATSSTHSSVSPASWPPIGWASL